DEPMLLLGRVRAKKGWSMPGGFFSPSDDQCCLTRCALREFVEETGNAFDLNALLELAASEPSVLGGKRYDTQCHDHKNVQRHVASDIILKLPYVAEAHIEAFMEANMTKLSASY